MGLSEPPTPGSRDAACMQCNQPIVIEITQSRRQSCSSATFVKVGVLQPIKNHTTSKCNHLPLNLRAGREA
eukprot:921979-Prymnesium_polylepis.1